MNKKTKRIIMRSCVIIQFREYIEGYLNELGLESNHLTQYFLIKEHYREKILNINKK